MYRTDTIAAVSTPRGTGGIAVIRISGDDALKVAERCFRPRKGSLSEKTPRTAVCGTLECGGGISDSAVAVFFRAPASFTGEDTVEISCHGGALLTEKALEAVLSAGAVLAEAGEFSRRALINGKLSMCEAEALSDMLTANSTGELKIASGGLSGELDRVLEKLYGDMKHTLAAFYAKIDFPDEDLADMTDRELADRIGEMLGVADGLIEGYEKTTVVRQGIPAVICGVPNVGKSSLYNALSGKELAIVTEIAGTTRDVLFNDVAVGDVYLRLYDTAGVRDAEEKIERIGVERTEQALRGAALAILVFDGSEPAGESEIKLYEKVRKLGCKIIPVINKTDLPIRFDTGFLAEEAVYLSALTGEGKDTLEKRIEELFSLGDIDLSDGAFLATKRQYSAALACRDALAGASDALKKEMPPECAAGELEHAMRHIGELTGRNASEDVIDEIFSAFCVGK